MKKDNFSEKGSNMGMIENSQGADEPFLKADVPPFMRKQAGFDLKFYDPEDLVKVGYYSKVPFNVLIFKQIDRLNFYIAVNQKQYFSDCLQGFLAMMSPYEDSIFKKDMKALIQKSGQLFQWMPKNPDGSPSDLRGYNDFIFRVNCKKYSIIMDLLGRKGFLANKEI